MIVKIDGKIVHVLENVLPNTTKELDQIIVPNLNESPVNILDALDKFNYDLLSQTETTEYLYRFSRHGSDFYLGGGFTDALTGAFMDVGEVINQTFLWWL